MVSKKVKTVLIVWGRRRLLCFGGSTPKLNGNENIVDGGWKFGKSVFTGGTVPKPFGVVEILEATTFDVTTLSATAFTKKLKGKRGEKKIKIKFFRFAELTATYNLPRCVVNIMFPAIRTNALFGVAGIVTLCQTVKGIRLGLPGGVLLGNKYSEALHLQFKLVLIVAEGAFQKVTRRVSQRLNTGTVEPSAAAW